MANSRDVIAAEALQAMTAAERSMAVRNSLVTDLETLDEHTAEVVERGRARLIERFQ